MFGERNSMQSQTLCFICFVFRVWFCFGGLFCFAIWKDTKRHLKHCTFYLPILKNVMFYWFFPKSRNNIARLYLPSHPIPPSGILPGHKRRQPWKMSTHQILMSPLGVLHKYSKDLWLCGRPKDYPSFAMFTWELFWYDDWLKLSDFNVRSKKNRENISKIVLVAKFDSVKV